MYSGKPRQIFLSSCLDRRTLSWQLLQQNLETSSFSETSTSHTLRIILFNWNAFPLPLKAKFFLSFVLPHNRHFKISPVEFRDTSMFYRSEGAGICSDRKVFQCSFIQDIHIVSRNYLGGRGWLSWFLLSSHKVPSSITRLGRDLTICATFFSVPRLIQLSILPG